MNLKQFLDIYGLDTSTNFDLLKWAKELKIHNFKVLMKNELYKLKKTKKNFIICNYQTTKEGGTHWTALYKNKDKVYYFDSYGLQPDFEVLNFLDKGVYSTFKIQKDNARYCGQLCLYVLYKLSKGYDFYDIVLELYKELC